jgi:hypothetical protein
LRAENGLPVHLKVLTVDTGLWQGLDGNLIEERALIQLPLGRERSSESQAERTLVGACAGCEAAANLEAAHASPNVRNLGQRSTMSKLGEELDALNGVALARAVLPNEDGERPGQVKQGLLEALEVEKLVHPYLQHGCSMGRAPLLH